MFSIPPGKTEEGSKIFGEKINFYCPPLTGLNIRWNFASISSRLRGPLAQPFRKKGGKGDKLSIARHKRIAGICFKTQP